MQNLGVSRLLLKFAASGGQCSLRHVYSAHVALRTSGGKAKERCRMPRIPLFELEAWPAPFTPPVYAAILEP
jgi:hypothetical protein